MLIDTRDPHVHSCIACGHSGPPSEMATGCPSCDLPPVPANKYAHVRAAPNPGGHTCHWPGCTVQCKPAFWGCQPHWYALPSRIRARIWASYRAGQEVDKSPSREYLFAVQEAEAWIRESAPPPPPPAPQRALF